MRNCLATMLALAVVAWARADDWSDDEFTVRLESKMKARPEQQEEPESHLGQIERHGKQKAEKTLPDLKCHRCMGKGTISVVVRETCARCGGEGIVTTTVDLKDTRLEGCVYHTYRTTTTRKALNKQPCARCNRRGTIAVKREEECSYCKGAGWIPRSRK